MSKVRQILNLSYCRYYSVQQAKKKLPIISCKRPEFNHYEGQTYNKFEGIKLASKGWLHNKSKNDYFIIYGDANKKEEKEVYKKSFEEIGVCPELIEVISRQGFELPTLIQTKAIPSILKGNNTMITAETGCGKTLGYLLPILQHVLEWKPSLEEQFNSPLAVVISPSRELATQIGEVASNIAENLNLNITTLVGGKTKRKMINPPIEYCDILITTLGAFSKLVTTGIYKTHNVHHVVLDEADTLLDDSFIEKLSPLMKKFNIQFQVVPQVPPKGCQLTLVSATMPHELPESVSSFVAPDSLKTVTTSNIHRILPHVPQKFLRLGKAQKPLELLKLVQADVSLKRPVMIFSNQTSTCDFVSMFLNENNIECININGQMSVDLKMGKFDLYKSGKVNVISCTDIASRGLDTTRTQHVINYDFPLYTADYIHRCGRTGRIGSPGSCLVTNFVAWPREIAQVQKIETSIRKHDALPAVNANIGRIIGHRIAKMAALIFGVVGACRREELAKVTTDDVELHGKILLLKIPDTKTKITRSFVISDHFYSIVKKYESMRTKNAKSNRFFQSYLNGKCKAQCVGINKFGKMPKEIASYLQLPNPEMYTGHNFRRTSATLLADSGADLTTLKRHGGWKSSSVAESYIEDSIENKKKIAAKFSKSVPIPESSVSNSTPATSKDFADLYTDQNPSTSEDFQNFYLNPRPSTSKDFQNFYVDPKPSTSKNVHEPANTNNNKTSSETSQCNLSQSIKFAGKTLNFNMNNCTNVNFYFGSQ